MEIRNDPYDSRNRQANREALRADITRPNRDAIEETTNEVLTRRADRIEVSRTSREMTDRVRDARREEDAARAERVRELEQAHRRGELNTDERIDQAAIRMLESE
jgi:hypothetical protein